METLNLQEINRLLMSCAEIDDNFRREREKLFNSAKIELLSAFDNHAVTQELLGGPTASNLSGTLGGEGNLYAFIGFPIGYNPIGVVKELLISKLKMGAAVKNEKANGFEYKFPINIPLEEIYSETPLPFETGNSWVAGIEQGISGFSNFLYRASKMSRSSRGIETTNVIRGSAFQPTPYLSNLLKKFIINLGGDASFIFSTQ